MIKIDQRDFDKAVGQLKLQLNGVFSCFRCYGLDIYVDEAIKECVNLAVQFSMRVRGKDTPIKMKNHPQRRPTE